MTKGLDIVLKDTSYQRTALSYDAPVSDGLLGWFFLGGDVERSAINLAEDMPDAVVFGSPVVSEHYLSLKGKLNFIRTRQLLPSLWSMVVVARSFSSPFSGTARPMYMGTSDLNTAGGGIYVSSTTGIAMVDYKGAASEVTTVTSARSHNDWSCIIARASEEQNVIANMTTGTVQPEAHTLPGTLTPSVSPVGIGYGGSNASQYEGTSDIAMAAFYGRTISDAEAAAIYARLQAYYARRSIAI